MIILDNAQWVDEASLALTNAVAQGVSGTAPMLLLLAQRPPQLGEDAVLPDLEAIPISITLQLSELHPEEVALLLERRLGAPADALLAEVITQMGRGNPYFTGELLAAMQAGEQVALGEDGRWEVAPVLLAILQKASVVLQQEGRWRLQPDIDLAELPSRGTELDPQANTRTPRSLTGSPQADLEGE